MSKNNDELFELILEVQSQINNRLDTIEGRIGNIDENLDNLATETRSYFKRIDDHMDTLTSVVQRVSYNVLENDVKIERIKERLEQ